MHNAYNTVKTFRGGTVAFARGLGAPPDPFVPKSASHLVPVQFWALPFCDCSFGSNDGCSLGRSARQWLPGADGPEKSAICRRPDSFDWLCCVPRLNKRWSEEG